MGGGGGGGGDTINCLFLIYCICTLSYLFALSPIYVCIFFSFLYSLSLIYSFYHILICNLVIVCSRFGSAIYWLKSAMVQSAGR